MVKKLITPLALTLLTSSIQIKADAGDAVLGGILGFTAGVVTSAVCNPSVVYVEEPVYVEPVFVEQPVMVEQVVVQDPYIEQKRAELAWREANVRRTEAKQAARARRNAAKVVETRTVAQPEKSLHEREIALREQEIKLQLLKEENKKKELALKEKELELKKAKAQKKGDDDEEEFQRTVTKTITKQTTNHPSKK